MRHAPFAAVLLLAGCVAAHRPPADAPSPVGPDGRERSLWETDEKTLEAAFRRFTVTPGTTPDPRFAALCRVNGEVRFAAVPAGWTVWGDAETDVSEIKCEDDEFRVSIRFLPDDQRSDWPPGVSCGKGKGDVRFDECRAIRTHGDHVSVVLRVCALPGSKATLSDMLAQLRKHYGEYEGVCQQVKNLAVR